MQQMNTSVSAGRNVVVVGTQWGDEGKGKVVDWLTDHAQAVVRMVGQPIDDLALALITPLGTDDDDVASGRDAGVHLLHD